MSERERERVSLCERFPECCAVPSAIGFSSKVEVDLRSAKGAEYDSQGQALSEAKRVAPG